MRPRDPSLFATSLCVAFLLCPAVTSGQKLDDASRLAGVGTVAVSASAEWDELITMEAGGATASQFQEALLIGLREAVEGAERGPAVDEEATTRVHCHVDTFYDRGLVVYSARVEHRRDTPDGPVIDWLESWVGSYTAQQLHVIWNLADQCADAFVEAWAEANPS